MATLLEKALALAEQEHVAEPEINFAEKLELVMAWARSQISTKQMTAVLFPDNPPNSNYTIKSRYLAGNVLSEAIKLGLLVEKDK